MTLAADSAYSSEINFQNFPKFSKIYQREILHNLMKYFPQTQGMVFRKIVSGKTQVRSERILPEFLPNDSTQLKTNISVIFRKLRLYNQIGLPLLVSSINSYGHYYSITLRLLPRCRLALCIRKLHDEVM